jgi:peroxiredoxin
MAFRHRRELLEAGTPAPQFRLPRLDGSDVSLAGLLASGPVALVFFKITCPVCQMTLPFLERIHAAKSAIPIYGISQNGPLETRDFARQFGITFPLLLDGENEGYEVSNAFGIASVPTTFVIEKEGLISMASEGWSRRDVTALGERAGVNPLRPGDQVPELKAG